MKVFTLSAHNLGKIIEFIILFILFTELGLGSNCTMDAMCEDINAVCDPNSETCVCFGDFYDSNFCAVPGGTCDPSKLSITFLHRNPILLTLYHTIPNFNDLKTESF